MSLKFLFFTVTYTVELLSMDTREIGHLTPFLSPGEVSYMQFNPWNKDTSQTWTLFSPIGVWIRGVPNSPKLIAIVYSFEMIHASAPHHNVCIRHYLALSLEWCPGLVDDCWTILDIALYRIEKCFHYTAKTGVRRWNHRQRYCSWRQPLRSSLQERKRWGGLSKTPFFSSGTWGHTAQAQWTRSSQQGGVGQVHIVVSVSSVLQVERPCTVRAERRQGC